MNRSAPLKRTRMPKGRGHPIPAKVRAQVRARSGGFCEVGSAAKVARSEGGFCVPEKALFRICYAQDMHHLVKRPRLHEPWAIVHLCRQHHSMCEEAYSRGRLVFRFHLPLGPFTTKEDIDEIWWAIEVRERKGAPLLKTLGEGRIQL